MRKQKIRLLIPLAIVGGVLIYSWISILLTEAVATWRHYLALFLFVILVILWFKNFKWAMLATAIYLLLATFNLLGLTPTITSNAYGVRIGSVQAWTPTFQWLSFGILVLYSILNFDTLTEMYLDYKEERERKMQNE